jgi:hypothetical protein
MRICPMAIIVIMLSPFCSRSRHLVFALLCSLLVLLSHLSALASQSIEVGWNLSGDSQVVSYKIYFGTMSRDYVHQVAVGHTNVATIAGLAAGVTYYFAAAAVDGKGNESAYSDEVVFTTTPLAAAILKPAQVPAGEFGFTVSGGTGTAYVIQSSSNLIDWVSVLTNTAPFTFSDMNVPGVRQCFYRSFCFTP